MSQGKCRPAGPRAFSVRIKCVRLWLVSQAGISVCLSFVNVGVDLQVLHGFCSDILASKPTSLEVDQQLLERLQGGTDVTDRQRLALQFRIAKKELLKACIRQYDPAQLAA